MYFLSLGGLGTVASSASGGRAAGGVTIGCLVGVATASYAESVVTVLGEDLELCSAIRRPKFIRLQLHQDISEGIVVKL